MSDLKQETSSYVGVLVFISCSVELSMKKNHTSLAPEVQILGVSNLDPEL